MKKNERGTRTAKELKTQVDQGGATDQGIPEKTIIMFSLNGLVKRFHC